MLHHITFSMLPQPPWPLPDTWDLITWSVGSNLIMMINEKMVKTKPITDHLHLIVNQNIEKYKWSKYDKNIHKDIIQFRYLESGHMQNNLVDQFLCSQTVLAGDWSYLNNRHNNDNDKMTFVWPSFLLSLPPLIMITCNQAKYIQLVRPLQGGLNIIIRD